MADKRTPPKRAAYFGWAAFEKWADKNDIGTHPDDWKLEWDCWRHGYIAGVNN